MYTPYQCFMHILIFLSGLSSRIKANMLVALMCQEERPHEILVDNSKFSRAILQLNMHNIHVGLYI